MKAVAAAALAAILIPGTWVGSPSSADVEPLGSQPQGNEVSWDPGSVIVRYRPELTSAAVSEMASDRGLRFLRTVGVSGHVLMSTEGKAPTDVARQLASDPRVVSVELNHRRRIAATPNDPRFGPLQPYLTNLGMPAAWDRSQGSPLLKIAIVDTGVDLDHPDLLPVLPGRDFANGDLIPDDDNGHGTVVAGIAAAKTNNAIGIAGAAWNASILPVKVLDSAGTGFDANVAGGIVWAADNGASVINISLGGTADTSVLRSAVDYALSKNVVVVGAAGNNGSSIPVYPAAYPGVLDVSATDATGQIASFSNFGPWVDIAAPGVGINSTSPAVGPLAAYSTGNGTSFAAPIVSGVAALVRALHPQWSQATVVDVMQRTSRDLGPTGFDDRYGFGWVDPDAALRSQGPVTVPPPPPTQPVPTAGSGAFHAMAPQRVLDTRAGIGQSSANKVPPGGDVLLDVTGTAGVPSTGVSAVVMNLTATVGTQPSFLTAYPADESRPVASNLNFLPDQDIANLVTVKVGSDGNVRIYNNGGSVHVVADVVGWYGDGSEADAGSRFTPLPPARILDTRDGTGQGGSTAKVGPASSIEVDVTGPGGVPTTDVSAVVMNVTATAGTQPSFLTAFPADESRPIGSNLNLGPGQDVANLVTVKVGADGNVRIYNNGGSVHVLADVVGWYGAPGGTSGGLFTPLTPARILDTRDGTGQGGSRAKVAQGSTIVVDATGPGGIPTSGASAVVTNVTATESTLATFLTVYPAEPRPTASNLNTLPGRDVPNLAVARVGQDGNVRIYNNAGSVHVVADVVGFFNG